MKTGQKVKLRPGRRVASGDAIPADADGVVVCSYRLLANRCGGAERVDVDFKPYGMLWAHPADAFEAAAEQPSR